MHRSHSNRQFVRYVIPAVIGMVVQALYVVLDGIIVGQGIGEIALAAVNIAFPCGMVVIALAMMISVGGANVYSFYKGRGEETGANNIFSQCLSLCVIIGAVIAVMGSLFVKQLAVFLGANDLLYPSAVAYLKWLAPISLIQMTVCCLSTFIRNDDAPRTVMFATVTGAVVNALLDIVFILILKFGIEVSAITNGVGMLIELAFYAAHFFRRKGKLTLAKPKFNFPDIKRILSNGFATFLMEFSLPAVTFSFNIAIVNTVGTMGVTAYSIVGYVCALINMTLIGVTQGTQPLMSYYHGNRDSASFSHTYHMGLRTNIVVPVVLVGLCAVFSDFIVRLFHPGNPELTALTSHIMRLYPIAHIPIGITLMNILYFQTTENNAFSSLIALLRCVGFIQVFILLSVFVLEGRLLYLAFFAGEFCHMLLSVLLIKRVKRLENTRTV